MWIRRSEWDELVREVGCLWDGFKRGQLKAEPTFRRGDVVEIEGQEYRFHLICGPQSGEGRWRVVGSDGLYWWASAGTMRRVCRDEGGVR